MGRIFYRVEEDMSSDKKGLADTIKKHREAMGMNQATLAKLVKVSQSYISKIEAGKIDPRVTEAFKIFQVLKIKYEGVGK